MVALKRGTQKETTWVVLDSEWGMLAEIANRREDMPPEAQEERLTGIKRAENG
jgi:hypothetical protein